MEAAAAELEPVGRAAASRAARESGDQAVDDGFAIALGADEAGLAKDPQVMGQQGALDPDRPRQIAHRARLSREVAQDGEPAGISDDPEPLGAVRGVGGLEGGWFWNVCSVHRTKLGRQHMNENSHVCDGPLVSPISPGK